MIRVDAVWLCTEPMDMRAGTDTTLARVVQFFGAARPHHAYVFANKRSTRLKVLVHDGIGIWLAARRLRKIIKTRGHFPSDDAATKLIWLALRNITADWGRAAKEWRDAMNQFAILYEERFTQPNHGSARTGG